MTARTRNRVRAVEGTFWPGLRTMVDGSGTHPVPALIATVAGVINGATIVLAAALAVLSVGARRVETGDLSVGVLVEVVYLLLTISIPLSVISRFLGMLPISAAGRSRVRDVLGSTETTAYGGTVLSGDGAVSGNGALVLRARGVGLVRDGTRLLDDATSALDPAVEREVLAGVAALRGQVTILIVGGRPSSIMIADRVAFLRAGRLVAVGTHTELLGAEPDYRRILRAYGEELRAQAVTTFVQNGGVVLLVNITQMIIAGVIMTAYSWQLALPVLGLSVLLFVTMCRSR